MLLAIFGRSWQYYAMVLPAVLICITFHEVCHGYVAYLLGDGTAKEAGRLTLNPIRHLDLVGALCMIVAGVGWAKPVPIDPRRMWKIKNHKLAIALTALAGPLSNMLLAFLLFFAYLEIAALTPSAFLSALGEFLYITAYLSVGLAAFNLLPIPPLDGSKILFPLLPNKVIAVTAKYERYISLAFFALILMGVLNKPIEYIRSGILYGMSAALSWIIHFL